MWKKNNSTNRTCFLLFLSLHHNSHQHFINHHFISTIYDTQTNIFCGHDLTTLSVFNQKINPTYIYTYSYFLLFFFFWKKASYSTQTTLYSCFTFNGITNNKKCPKISIWKACLPMINIVISISHLGTNHGSLIIHCLTERGNYQYRKFNYGG